MSTVTHRFDVPPGVLILEDDLPRLAAAAVEAVKRTVYVYEDCIERELLLTTYRDDAPRLGTELLMIAWPGAGAGSLR